MSLKINVDKSKVLVVRKDKRPNMRSERKWGGNGRWGGKFKYL